MKTLTATGVLAASMLAIPAPAHAGVHVGIGIHIGSGYRYGGPDAFRIGYDRGYEDGHREGVKDGRHGDRFGFRDEGRYRSGDHGYRGHYGPRFEYGNGYRRGFEAGYRRGYEPYGYRYDRREHDRYGDRHRHPGSRDWCYERHSRW